MTADDNILVARDGPVTTVTINRPDARNALDNESARTLARAFQAFDADETAKVAVLTGTDGTFCAGADLKALADGIDYEPWATGPEGPTRPLVGKPVIAAVAGYACAGGLGLALWCDLRVVEESATFAIFSRRWGVPMSDGTTVRLPRLIGMSRALDMMLTGRPVAAEEALAMGLANRLVADGQARQAAEDLARQIAEFPEIAMRSDRLSVYRQAGRPLEEALAAETELATEARAKEAQSGARRFAAGAGRHGSFGAKRKD